jgi:hypothetical protein
MRFLVVCFAFTLAGFSARADVAPEPDHGPPIATVAGLDFAVQTVEEEKGPVVGGRYYSEPEQVVVLTGCTAGHPNCKLAKSKNLIGMEVLSVDDESLHPEIGMVRQIINNFSGKTGKRTVALELFSRGSNNESIRVSFARK